jgi:Asp-tRNA(Asn)/Glu-tRNA(Gln) amidotransferase A subunit family amidase
LASLINVLRGLASGELPAQEYLERVLHRVQTREPIVHAFAHIDVARARSLAEACDKHRRSGGTIGPLHGLPVAVKDTFDTTDLRTEAGLPFMANHYASEDAWLVARIRQAGGYVLGKTVTAEASFTHPGETRNPWNPQHSPGGSSAGSAAAIAAGFAHAAIGSQTNDSVIRPAAYCGVVGFKPTQGMLSLDGALRFSPSLDQAGVFARSVLDAAALCAALVTDSESRPAAYELPAPPQLGLITDFPWTSLDAEAAQHLAQVVRVLSSRGARITPITLPPAYLGANSVHRLIMLHEGARQLGELQVQFRGQMSNALNDALDEGRRISPATYGESMVRRARLIEGGAALFGDMDGIITAAASGPAPARFGSHGDPGYSTLWSLLGMPAITVPTGFASNALPLGMQIAAPAAADDRLLSVAHWIQATLGASAQSRQRKSGAS